MTHAHGPAALLFVALTSACTAEPEAVAHDASAPDATADTFAPDAATSAEAGGHPDAQPMPEIDAGPAVIFWTESNVVRGAALDGRGPRIIATGTFPTGVAIDLVAGKVYWADNGTDTVSRANCDGTGVEVLYTSPDPASNPTGIALDHAANKLFWAEPGIGVIKAANLDGSDVVVLYTGTFPIGVAANPARTELYFSDNGTDTIRVGGYDGGATSLLYTADSGLANPTGVAIEPSEGQVFWGESGGVFRMQADGGAPMKIATPAFPGGVAIDPIALRVYFTDNANDSVTSVDFDGGSPHVVYLSADPFSNPYGVALRR